MNADLEIHPTSIGCTCWKAIQAFQKDSSLEAKEQLTDSCPVVVSHITLWPAQVDGPRGKKLLSVF